MDVSPMPLLDVVGGGEPPTRKMAGATTANDPYNTPSYTFTACTSDDPTLKALKFEPSSGRRKSMTAPAAIAM